MNRYCVFASVAAFVAGTAIFYLVSRWGSISSPPSPSRLEAMLLTDGWIPLTYPQQGFSPGAIVTITPANGVQYRSHLKNCFPTEDFIGQTTEKFQTGLSGVLQQELAIGGEGLFKSLNGSVLGVALSAAASHRISLENVTSMVMDDIQFKQFVEQRELEQQSYCRSMVFGTVDREKSELKNNVYIVREALRADSYSYSVFNENGGMIDFSQEYPNEIVQAGLKAEANGKLSAELSSVGEVFIAIRDPRLYSEQSGAGAVSEDIENPDEKVRMFLIGIGAVNGSSE